MGKVLVRVTMFPEPIEVDEDEIPGLRQQGLLIEDPTAELQRARDAAAAEVERLDELINATNVKEDPNPPSVKSSKTMTAAKES